MAHFAWREDERIEGQYENEVKGVVYGLVETAASGVGWNSLCIAPKGFDRQVEQTKKGARVVDVHTRTGIKFKAGFHMLEEQNMQQKWEGHAISKDGRYRLDLQNVENGFAIWAVQTNGANSKTVAECKMQCGVSFGQGQLAYALVQSAARRAITTMTHGGNGDGV